MRFRGGKPLVYGDPFQTGGGQPAWTPARLSPAIWLDAQDAGTITLNGSRVSSWSNKGSLGGSFANANSGQQPLYSTSDPDFGACVSADDSSVRLLISSVQVPALSAWTACFVFKQILRGSNYYVWAHIGNMNAARSVYMGQWGAALPFMVRYLNTDQSVRYSSTSFGDGSSAASVVVYGDFSQTGRTNQIQNIQVNGASEAGSYAGGGATAAASAAETMYLFAGPSGVYQTQCKIPEMLLFDRILTADERSALWAYQQAKWSL